MGLMKDQIAVVVGGAQRIVNTAYFLAEFFEHVAADIPVGRIGKHTFQFKWV